MKFKNIRGILRIYVNIFELNKVKQTNKQTNKQICYGPYMARYQRELNSYARKILVLRSWQDKREKSYNLLRRIKIFYLFAIGLIPGLLNLIEPGILN